MVIEKSKSPADIRRETGRFAYQIIGCLIATFLFIIVVFSFGLKDIMWTAKSVMLTCGLFAALAVLTLWHSYRADRLEKRQNKARLRLMDTAPNMLDELAAVNAQASSTK